MARAQRQPKDQDRQVITSVSSVDGVTPFPLEVNPATGRLLVDTVATGGGNVNLTGINSVTPDVGAGNKSPGTLRVTIATDDTNLSSIQVNTSNAATSAAQTNGLQKTQVTSNALSGGPLVGQAKVAVTSTAVQLNNGTSQVLINGIIISAPSTNVTAIAIGGSGVTNTGAGAGNGYLLTPGASISFAVTNTNTLWINGTANDFISWAAS